MTELLLASNNEHKTREFARLFPGVRIRVPREVGIEFDFHEEGDTFFANAHGKAAALHGLAGRPVIADDSGLCVDSLGGEPGIFSSRYGSPPGGAVLDAPRRNEYLLARMAGIEERSARFVCCLVLVLGTERFVSAQETVAGVITTAPRGAHGFGYDPVFFLTDRGRTMAELSDADKDRISHRGRAARRILAFLEEGRWT
jgi:XTP/dITP diphosphohydrolase